MWNKFPMSPVFCGVINACFVGEAIVQPGAQVHETIGSRCAGRQHPLLPTWRTAETDETGQRLREDYMDPIAIRNSTTFTHNDQERPAVAAAVVPAGPSETSQ